MFGGRRRGLLAEKAQERAVLADAKKVLRGKHTLWRAADRIVTLAGPFVDEVCRGVPSTAGFTADIAARAVVRRAHDALAAITTTVESSARASARVHLRTMADDLIFVKWLLGLDDAIATQTVQKLAWVEALKAVERQRTFLPIAYRRLGSEPPDLGLGDVSEELARATQDLKDWYYAQGWGRGGLTVRKMAEAADLVEEYEFFYYLSSKTVHANLHEMGRMAWGTTDTVDISSDAFQGVHADLAVVYGTWLFDYILGATAERFEPIARLANGLPYSVWLAMILVGKARNGDLPLVIHPRELGLPANTGRPGAQDAAKVD